MLGTKLFMGDANSLMFDIRGCKTINKIRVTLAADDTYTVTFYKIARGGLSVATIATREGIYNDMLHAVIESETGLYLSL